LPIHLESAELTLKSAKLIPACSKSARPTPQSAKPTVSTACHELARPTAYASAQVGLADFESAKLIFLVSAATDASSDNSTSVVDHVLEIKSGIMQIKNTHFSNMKKKVQDTNILLKFQSGHTISISASI